MISNSKRNIFKNVSQYILRKIPKKESSCLIVCNAVYSQRLHRRCPATRRRRRARRWRIAFELPSLQRCRDGRTHGTYTP